MKVNSLNLREYINSSVKKRKIIKALTRKHNVTSPPPPSSSMMMVGRPQEVGAELVDRRPLVPQVVINPFDDGRWRVCRQYVACLWLIYDRQLVGGVFVCTKLSAYRCH